MAGDDPKPEIKTHGIRGYALGCRCFVCRRSHANRKANERARQRERGKEQPDTANVKEGRMELLCQTELMGLGYLTDEAESQAHIALITAKLIDKIEREGTWHLLNATTKRYTEVMDKLRSTISHKSGGEDDGDDLLGSLGTFGATGA